jgi:Arc/MetJ-type ribon-helix-helix transcriptional regulator
MVKVDIPEEIYREIEKRVSDSGEFESVEEYILFVLEELLKEEEEEEQVLSEEEERMVKERLRGLGYL